MLYKDIVLNFFCEEESLFGILSMPEQPQSRAIVLIVGGPQYRVGSHRQFVQLARALAQAGYATLRFDHRGMGDSTGSPRSFEDLDADIAAAIEALQKQCPQVREVVLWGLCDAASAACIYAPHDPRVGGLILLNPWVRDTSSYARTQVKHYYGARLLDAGFWSKLVRGEVRVFAALREGMGTAWRAFKAPVADSSPRPPFQARMLEGLQHFDGQVLLFMSGRDLTAREFEALAAGNARWTALLNAPSCVRADVAEADHTFSSAEWKSRVEQCCIEWLNDLGVRKTTSAKFIEGSKA